MTNGVEVMHALLANAVDYAGLFPPAALSMAEAVANYATYVGSRDAWALGRFVVPIARLQELEAAVGETDVTGVPWRLSALVGNDVAGDGARVAAFNRATRAPLAVDVVEGRAQSLGDVAALQHAFNALEVYVEVAPNEHVGDMIGAIGAAGLRAKIRTGGVVADVFPSAQSVARFILECVRQHVPFKATAGLHHPLRGEYPLTYARDAARGTMFGFVNVFTATAAALEGAGQETLVQLLEARTDGTTLTARDGVRLNGIDVSSAAIARARREQIVSFGSCSFREPVDELLAMDVAS